MRNWAIVLLLGLLAACSSSETKAPQWGFCEPNQDPFPERPAVGEPARLNWLRVEGTDVVDEQGRRVALRGFNFGSWLMMETWIAGIGLWDEGELLQHAEQQADALGVGDLWREARAATALEWLTEARSHRVLVEEWRAYMYARAGAEQRPAIDALWAWFDDAPWIFEERSLWDYLARRHGFPDAQELRARFQDAFITEEDVRRLSLIGLNLVRLPVWFELLETDFEGGAHFKPEGFARLDRFLRWARRFGVYVVLDLHGAPGGQSASWHQGLPDGGHLFENPACLAKTERLWQALAHYFRDEPHIAAYDLLNEPMSSPGPEDYRRVHDALYRAVRAEDTRHIVMIEDAYLPASDLVSPAEMGWENAMFSVHLYPGGTSAEDYLSRMEQALTRGPAADARFRVPVLLGEFNAADGEDSAAWSDEGMRLLLDRLNRRGVHWAIWTWKYWTGSPAWGFTFPRAPERIDVAGASFRELSAAFAGLSTLDHCSEHTRLKTILQDLAAAPAAPLDLSSAGPP